MSARDEMLERVRQALGRHTEPRPESVHTISEGQFPRLEGVMPPIALEDRIARFEMELEKVAGSPHRASTLAELERALRGILGDSKAAEVVLTRNPLLANLGLPQTLQRCGIAAASWPGTTAASESAEGKSYRDRCFSAQVGISGVDSVLAETGSLILSSETEGSQLTSLAPPVHVALYRRGQVLGSLDEVLLSVSKNPGAALAGRSIVFITGPSRTADIEQILIRGVHGPREVHAVLVEESCLAELGK